MKRKRILVTNDDGIHSEGIVVLATALKSLAEVWVVAPDRERNAVGRALTLHRPLRIQALSNHRLAVNGTPTDCVMLGVNWIMKEKPDLVVSGINKGLNLGENVAYSGTVSAAMEATLLGISAFAISLDVNGGAIFQPAAQFAVRLARYILKHGISSNTLLNVNVPNTQGKKINCYKITRQGRRVQLGMVVEKVDPRGEKYYWISGSWRKYEDIENSDFKAIDEDYISITPLHLDHTHYSFFPEIKRWKI
jgi:5'-nucleotidase